MATIFRQHSDVRLSIDFRQSRGVRSSPYEAPLQRRGPLITGWAQVQLVNKPILLVGRLSRLPPAGMHPSRLHTEGRREGRCAIKKPLLAGGPARAYRSQGWRLLATHLPTDLVGARCGAH